MSPLLPLLCIIFIFVQTAIGQEWKNITPLKTTRIEAEKILGTPTEKNCRACIYTVSEGKIMMRYAAGKCQSGSYGWNVEADTVLGLSFVPNNSQAWDIERYDLKDFIYFTSHTLTRFFINPQTGISYIFSPIGELEEIEFTPKVIDNNLRCKGYPPYNAAGAAYIPSFAFNETDIETGKAHVFNLSNMPNDLRAYIMAYSGRNLSGKKYHNYLNELKRYIRTRLKENYKNVKVIDAGKRDLFLVEGFVLPIDYPPPMP